MNKKIFLISSIFGVMLPLHAQECIVPLPFGDMDNWVTRQIKESGIIGGNTKLLYELGPVQTIIKNEPYKNTGGSPWANSNVLAKVAGVVKTNTSVFPEKRGNGYCARLETRFESVRVLGLVDIEVIAAGSLFTGTIHEPITGTKNPMKKLDMGIPYKEKPKAVQFDYKVKMSGQENRVRSTGFSRKSEVKGMDHPSVILLIQKRWEDEDGNVYAKRIGTMVTRYSNDTEWINAATYPIHYGDISKQSYYQEEWMKLQDQDRYTLNSKGKNVIIQETGWADENETPTHLILQFTSSHGGAYVGSPGNMLWIDNVSLIH